MGASPVLTSVFCTVCGSRARGRACVTASVGPVRSSEPRRRPSRAESTRAVQTTPGCDCLQFPYDTTGCCPGSPRTFVSELPQRQKGNTL